MYYFDQELLKLVQKHYGFSKEEAEIYISAFHNTEKLKEDLKKEAK